MDQTAECAAQMALDVVFVLCGCEDDLRH